VPARGTIDLHEISRPEILDPGRIQRDHLRARCSPFVHIAKIITGRALSSTRN
jgi:hypothetical protein